MSKGCLLIGLGHPYYGRMAFNMAVSIKHVEPEMPICLVISEGSLSHLSDQPTEKYFDKIIVCPKEYHRYGKNLQAWIKAKVFMYNLSPFDETLFLDVDALWLPRHKPSEIFEQLKDIDFTMSNSGFHDYSRDALNDKYSQWLNISDVKRVFGDGKYYSLHSEFVYFKKCERVAKYFEAVQFIYDDVQIKKVNNIKTAKQIHGQDSFLVLDFAGALPDEFAFACACIVENYYPHTSPYMPNYWKPAQGNKGMLADKDLKEKFYTYSIGGKVANDAMKNFYNGLSKWYFQVAGLANPYQITRNEYKRSFLSERSAI